MALLSLCIGLNMGPRTKKLDSCGPTFSSNLFVPGPPSRPVRSTSLVIWYRVGTDTPLFLTKYAKK